MKLPKITPKPMLTGYTQTLVWISGTIIAATVITGGYLWYRAQQSKPVQPSTTNETAATTPAKTNYDGTYKGTTNVANVNGLADVSINVVGTTLSGTATYHGTYNGYAISGPVKITGTVTDSGKVSAGLAGSGSLYGEAYVIGGSTQGQITNNTMTCDYSGTSSGIQFSGKIALPK